MAARLAFGSIAYSAAKRAWRADKAVMPPIWGNCDFGNQVESAEGRRLEGKEHQFYWVKPSNREEGEYRDGKLNGRGVWTSVGGFFRYEGELRDSEWNGPGVVTLPTGDRVEGKYRGRKLNGQGVFTMANGDLEREVVRHGKISCDFPLHPFLYHRCL
jgi:hypothetical protein